MAFGVIEGLLEVHVVKVEFVGRAYHNIVEASGIGMRHSTVVVVVVGVVAAVGVVVAVAATRGNGTDLLRSVSVGAEILLEEDTAEI